MAYKTKPDTAGLAQLKKDLAQGKPGRLYVFHGEETYLRDHYLGKLREVLLSGGMGEFNLHRLRPADVNPRALEEAVDCLPMMAERTMVLVTDFDLFKAGERDREEYIRTLSQLPEYCCLVFVYDLLEYKPDARTKLAAALKANGTAVNFQRQEQGDLVDWVRRRFKALGKEIDPRLALELISLCGDLMTTLIGEIEKVGAYARGPKITRADIDAVAAPQLDAVVFEMTDAIGAGSFDQAASVLGELFQMQEPPQKILWSLGRQMRQIYSARLALEGGKGSREVSALWGIKPYPADKLMRSARRFTLGWCRQAVVRCAQTDLDMKSTGRDGQELLTTLLLELAALSSNTGARR
ncbi:DNA polymerase III subunit delta [Oscillospiraceae bacterium 50-16]|nr:DNA polymerase III subunit delta [Lawsonibacter sp.]